MGLLSTCETLTTASDSEKKGYTAGAGGCVQKGGRGKKTQGHCGNRKEITGEAKVVLTFLVKTPDKSLQMWNHDAQEGSSPGHSDS